MTDRRFTVEQLVAEARAQGLDCSARRVRDWTELGLLAHPTVKGRGRGRGVVATRDSAQAELLVTLLDWHQRRGVRKVATLAKWPVWMWLTREDGYVPLAQARRALETWANDAIQPRLGAATSVARVTTHKYADAPGGVPRALLEPTILGVEITMPVVGFQPGWVAVLLPSANRTLAWLPRVWLEQRPLRDQLVVETKLHRMTWFRDSNPVQFWTVTLGQPRTPTPLGRSYLLGRSSLPGKVYAGLDVWALASVPDDPAALPTALQGAHIGIHAWYNDRNLGKDTSDGCIRLTRSGQQKLLASLAPGTVVTVLE